MSVYLAWSVYKLAMAFIALLGISGLVATVNTKAPRIKKSLLTFAVGAVIILGMAFNIGQRQSELKRSSFNAPPPAAVAVKAEKGMTRENVKQTFEQAVKVTTE